MGLSKGKRKKDTTALRCCRRAAEPRPLATLLHVLGPALRRSLNRLLCPRVLRRADGKAGHGNLWQRGGGGQAALRWLARVARARRARRAFTQARAQESVRGTQAHEARARRLACLPPACHPLLTMACTLSDCQVQVHEPSPSSLEQKMDCACATRPCACRVSTTLTTHLRGTALGRAVISCESEGHVASARARAWRSRGVRQGVRAREPQLRNCLGGTRALACSMMRSLSTLASPSPQAAERSSSAACSATMPARE